MSRSHRLLATAAVDSPVHRAPASAKLFGTLGFVTSLAFVPAGHLGWTSGALALVLALFRFARLPFSGVATRLALAQPFVLGVAVLALFQGRGLAVLVAIALKSTASVAALQLLAQTTPFHELLDVLRRARLPAVLISTLGLLHRYLFVLADEAQRMARARRARTWRSRRWDTWRALASVIALLFVRSMARAERISAAMQARGGS